jgi:biopolymer transport protein ExbD
MIGLWKSLFVESYFKRLFMTDITTAISENRRKSFYHKKTQHLKIDMTPMVDLGFLLISFFVITTEMSEPVTTNLYMPDDKDSSNIPESKTLSILLTKNNTIFYYNGGWEHALAKNEIIKTDFSMRGIRNVIQKKQSVLNDKRNEVMILFKADTEASYQNIIDIIDEMLINDVRKYALLKMTSKERNFLKTHP